MRKLFISAVLAMAGVFGTALSASAHSNIVSSQTACFNIENGAEIVYWHITNDWNLSEVASVTVPDPTLYPIFPSSVNIDASPSITNESGGVVSERFPGDPVGTFSLTAVGVWSDGYSSSATGYVTLTGACPTPTTTVAPVPTTIAPTPTTVAPVVAPVVPATTPAPVAPASAPVVSQTTTAPVVVPPAPVTTVTPMHVIKRHHHAVVKVIKTGAVIPAATAVHTGMPFAGTLRLVELVSVLGALMLAAGIALSIRRRHI